MKQLFWWSVTVLWMLFMIVLSHQTGDESSATSTVIVRFLQTFLPFFNEDTLSLLVRKSAHMTEYFILMYFMHESLQASAISKPLILAFLLTVLFSATDEFHQTYVPGRNGSGIDVVIDSIGAYIYILIKKI